MSNFEQKLLKDNLNESPWGPRQNRPSGPAADDGKPEESATPRPSLGTSSGRQSKPGGGRSRPNPGSDVFGSNDLLGALMQKLFRLAGFGPGKGAGNGSGNSTGQEEGPRPQRIIAIALVIGLGLWLSSGLYLVAEGEQAAIMRFGRYIDTKGPGLRYHLPRPIETALIASVSVINRIESGDRLGRSDGEDVHMLTGDENLVALNNYTVHWHILDLQKFLFHSRSAEAIIRAAADSALREIVAKTPIDLVVAEARERINQDAQKLLQKLLDSYDLGVGIIEFILQRADPPDAVMDAFRDVQRAKADQERARNEAFAYRNDILPKARGQARQMILEAEAYQKSMVSKAEGEAGRFQAILSEYRKAPDVTRSRLSIETMEQVMAKTPKVLIDPSVANVVPYLPLPALKAQNVNPVKSEGTPS